MRNAVARQAIMESREQFWGDMEISTAPGTERIDLGEQGAGTPKPPRRQGWLAMALVVPVLAGAALLIAGTPQQVAGTAVAGPDLYPTTTVSTPPPEPQPVPKTVTNPLHAWNIGLAPTTCQLAPLARRDDQ